MHRSLRIVIGAVLALSIGAAASAQSKKVKASDLPEAVQATATQQSVNGQVTGYWEREQEGGVIYEVDLLVDGHAKGVLISPEGAVVAVQEEVEFEKLDSRVQAGIKQQAGDGKIARVFSVSKDGKVTRYVATVEKGGQKSNVQVTPEGTAPSGAGPQ